MVGDFRSLRFSRLETQVGATRNANMGDVSDQTASETKGNEGLYLEYCMVRLSWPARKAPLSILFNLTSTNSRLWINALSLNAPVSISRIVALLMVTLKIVMAQKAFLRTTFVQISSMRTSATADGNTAVGNSVILTLWNIICNAKGIREMEIIVRNWCCAIFGQSPNFPKPTGIGNK